MRLLFLKHHDYFPVCSGLELEPQLPPLEFAEEKQVFPLSSSLLLQHNGYNLTVIHTVCALESFSDITKDFQEFIWCCRLVDVQRFHNPFLLCRATFGLDHNTNLVHGKLFAFAIHPFLFHITHTP
eukprot:m.112647 g.112647  ORF g.112647 m.112647 type:complete len:126 (+) comp14096_c0_seq3:472-849(+)